MSWSFSGIGKPDAICRAIDTAAERYSGQSREEFDAAAPHLKALVQEGHAEAALTVNANGHASFTNGTKTNGSIYVEIRQLGQLCE